MSENLSKNLSKKKQPGAQLKLQPRLLLNDEIALGPGKADLLDAIKITGSISAAAKHLGMSYRRTWLLVDTMNRCFKQPLVETATGGSHGGGARVTALGESLLLEYRRVQTLVAEVSAPFLAQCAPLLRKHPLPPQPK